MDNNTKREIAKELAISFGTPIERAELVRNTSTDPNVYPRVFEKVFQRTEEELSESEAVITFIGENGLLQDRALNFFEIVERIEALGYELKFRDIEE